MSYHISPVLTRKYTQQDNIRNEIRNTYSSGSSSKLPHTMGTAASSNGLYQSSRIPSLPGGNNTPSNYRYHKLYNEKLFTGRLKTSPRTTLQGPLKADHNINVTSRRDSPYKSNPKHGTLSPLSRQKSRSLVDLNSYDAKDDSDSTHETKYEKNKYGFSISKTPGIGYIKQSGSSLSRKSEEILNSAKLKLAQLNNETLSTNRLHRRYGSSNDITAITDRIKKVKILNAQKSMDKNIKRESRRHSHSDDSIADTYSNSSSLGGISNVPNNSKLTQDRIDIASSEKSRLVNGLEKKVPSSTMRIKRQPSFHNGLTGLKNLGNTCFMNSILQCLCNNKLLRHYFCKKDYDKDLNETHAPTKGRLAIAFASLMNEIWTRDETSIAPSLLKSEVQKYARRFSGSQQQDAQEFLRFFIEGIHDDLNVIKQKPILSILDDSNLRDQEKSDIYWQRYLSREKSVIQDIFVGQLKSILTCTTCNYRSVTYDPFWDLSLPIPRTTRVDDVAITQCFQVFTKEEILDGEEKPSCEKCKKRRKCTKKFLIERFPQILVIHLKRFSGQRYRTKLDTKVNFPFELHLNEFAANDRGGEISYVLFGVSNHMGGTYGGHYTAYCKHPDTQQWHQYNDSRVNPIPPSKAISTSAYVLFYELKAS